MNDLISRQAAIEAVQNRHMMLSKEKVLLVNDLEKLPPTQPYTIQSDGRLWVTVDDIDKVTAVVVDEHKSKFCKQFYEDYEDAQPEIIYCKDCRKHNKKIGFDENFHTVWKEDACPLASWRGKAQGHEFDYQFCAYGERR